MMSESEPFGIQSHVDQLELDRIKAVLVKFRDAHPDTIARKIMEVRHKYVGDPLPAQKRAAMVEQEDRDAAADYAFKHDNSVWWMPEAIRDGQEDDGPLVQAFKSHRIAAEARGMEKAAKIASQREQMHEDAWYKAPSPEAKVNLDARKWEAHDVAATIRAALNGGQHE